jgi:hypothetical protein
MDPTSSESIFAKGLDPEDRTSASAPDYASSRGDDAPSLAVIYSPAAGRTVGAGCSHVNRGNPALGIPIEFPLTLRAIGIRR